MFETGPQRWKKENGAQNERNMELRIRKKKLKPRMRNENIGPKTSGWRKRGLRVDVGKSGGPKVEQDGSGGL